MSTKFYTLLTDIGAAKLASAAALGVPLKITHMAVGDGGGVLPTPDAKQTALVNEKRRAALNMLYIDPQNSSQIIAEQVIPENEGGWWIREVGLFDESGALIAVGNCPESYKPQLAEGSGRTQTVRMVLITSSTDNITLKIDPAVVLATRKYVDDKVLELKVYVDDLMAKHLIAQDPHSQYAPKASPTFSGTPKAPTPAAGNNTTQVATTAFVQAALTALINGAPATLDTLKEIAAAINNDPNFSTTINNALALKAPLSSPALTGTPTAPTAAQSVNNTQIATTAFVKSAIAGMVGSAPAALDTLNELAAALGNDPNFATTMLNALAGKQPLDNTLTNLSGKDVAGLLAYLGIDSALAAKQPLDATLTGLSGKNDVGLRAYLSLKSAATRDVGSLFGQIPGMDLFSSTIAGTGEKAIPDFNTGTGLFILKWGVIAAPTTSQDITTLFQTPFPNKCLRVFATADYGPGTGNAMYIAVNNSTLQRDRFVARFAGSANYTSGVYFAMGY
ncbi:phage tail protein [Citrobacter portucalensis]|uniref:phage tail protein n=2 Tax=Enterobacteriaceae TaxID=543 RepID=UPI00226B275F|nr:phage tail protein [Citrobacter portucalensis]MCX9040695.1 phage tail protein [Citrobacter portucalensis]